MRISTKKRSTQAHGPSREASGGGFTLVEAVVSVGILSLLVGLTFPLAELYLKSKFAEETREKLDDLSQAIVNFYLDVEAFPQNLGELVSDPGTYASWMGPYLVLDFDDDDSNLLDFRYDAWRQQFQYTTVSTTARSLKSVGPNGTDDEGAGDDIVITVDAGVALREITRNEVEIINIAILNYNRNHLPADPLPTDYPTLLYTLQAQGYLPSDVDSTQRFLNDAWGQQYQTAGLTPVLEIFSAGAP